jgi:hypothetical protein
MAVPDWKLERILLGEESDEGLGPDDRARLEALRASNEEILGRYPPALVAERMARRVREEERAASRAAPGRAAARFRPVLWGAPALAGLAAVFFLSVGGDPAAVADGPEVTRAKGDVRPALTVHRRGAGGPERLGPGAVVRAGDVLQLSYAAAGAAHGAILSVDGRGAVTLHHPARPDGSTALRAEGETPLPEAYELDAAPGFERFFLVTGPGPVDVGAVLEAARRLAADPARAREAALELPAGLAQTSVLLVKR